MYKRGWVNNADLKSHRLKPREGGSDSQVQLLSNVNGLKEKTIKNKLFKKLS
jgi:hypothetical protein